MFDCILIDKKKSNRAHVTNTQLGQEEQSASIRLIVRGSDSDAVDVPVRIVIPPSHTEIVKGTPVSELHCIANARFVPCLFSCYYSIINHIVSHMLTRLTTGY